MLLWGALLYKNAIHTSKEAHYVSATEPNLLNCSGKKRCLLSGEVRWGEVTLRLTVSQSVSMPWYRAPLWDLRPDITSCRNFAVWTLRSSRSGSHVTTDGRSVSQYVKVSSPLWDLWPDFTFCSKVVVWKLLYCLCGAPSLTRGRVCHLSFTFSVSCLFTKFQGRRNRQHRFLYCCVYVLPSVV
jgi:hypothetical protein